MHVRTDHRRPSRSTGGIARRRPLPSFGLVLAVVLLAAVLAPLAASPRAALATARAPETAEPVAVQDDGTGDDGSVAETPVADTPIAEETPVADESPVVEETPSAGLAAQEDPHTSGIYVAMRDCTEVYGDDFQQFDANCIDAPQFQFDVYGVGNNGEGFQQTWSGSNAYGNLPAGQYTIRAFTPQGYRGPSVFCARDDVLNQRAGSYAEVVSVDGYVEFALAANEAIRCQWFFTPTVTGHGSLSLGFSVCPPVEAIPFPFDYDTADMSDLANLCSLSKDRPVPFLVYSHADGFNLTLNTDPTSGTVTWTTLAAGKQTLSTEPRSGYGTPRVFCYTTTDDANIFEVRVQDWEAELDVRAGAATVCDWFIIPVPTPHADATPDATPGATPVADPEGDADGGTGEDDADGATVTVVNYACPQTLAAPDGYDAYAEACTATTAGATFTLDGNRSGNPGEQTTAADGSASWPDREADTYELSEQEPTGSDGTPAVFCDTYIALDQLVPEYDNHHVSAEGRIEFDLAEGESITCSWFDTPEGDDQEQSPDGQQDRDQDQTQDQGDGSPQTSDAAGSITIYAWDCPVGFDVSAAEANPLQECDAASVGARLAITGPEGVTAAHASGDGIPGGVRWDGLGPGDYLIDDTQPDGAASGFVLACHGLTVPSDYPLYRTGSGAPLTIPLNQGQHVACLWFNVPAADQSTTSGPATTATGSGALAVAAD